MLEKIKAFVRAINDHQGSIIAVFTVLLVVVGFLQSYILLKTDYTLHETLESKRPWIAFDGSTFKVVEYKSDDDGARIVVRFDRIKNGGDTAARGVNVTRRILRGGPRPTNAKEINDAIKPFCDPKFVKAKYDEGEIVLPNQVISLGDIIFVASKKEFGDGRNAWVAGCIGYRGISDTPRATTFAYVINTDGEVERLYGLSSGGY
jgi:hypothetical protein